MPRLFLLTLCSLALGCGAGPAASNDPFTSGPGRATVGGMVTNSVGTPVPGTTVRIGCTGAADVVTPTDTLGRYLTNLTIPADSLGLLPVHPMCQFTEPATGAIRVQVDSAIRFGRGPILVALQTVDLEE